MRDFCKSHASLESRVWFLTHRCGFESHVWFLNHIRAFENIWVISNSHVGFKKNMYDFELRRLCDFEIACLIFDSNVLKSHVWFWNRICDFEITWMIIIKINIAQIFRWKTINQKLLRKCCSFWHVRPTTFKIFENYILFAECIFHRLQQQFQCQENVSPLILGLLKLPGIIKCVRFCICWKLNLLFNNLIKTTSSSS